jgi:hypothetical protein
MSIDNKDNSNKNSTLGNSVEIALAGVPPILSLLGAGAVGLSSVALTTLGGGISILISSWQMEQLKQFQKQVSQKFSLIDQTKLDREWLESPQFAEQVVRIFEEARLTTSILKRDALAKGLVNSALDLNDKLTGKLFFIRIVSYLSDEELQVLEVMQNAWENNVPILGKDVLQESLKDLALSQIQASCEGLVQQRVLEPINSEAWSLSIVGRKLVAWLSGKQEQENFEVFQKSCIAQLKKAIDSDREAIISEALIRGSREQARQALQMSGL